MNEGEAETDSDRSKTSGSATIGGANDDEEEDAGENGFSEDSGHDTNRVTTEGIETVSIESRKGPAVRSVINNLISLLCEREQENRNTQQEGRI